MDKQENGEEIHEDFSKEVQEDKTWQQRGEEEGFTYEDAQEGIANNFEPANCFGQQLFTLDIRRGWSG